MVINLFHLHQRIFIYIVFNLFSFNWYLFAEIRIYIPHKMFEHYILHNHSDLFVILPFYKQTTINIKVDALQSVFQMWRIVNKSQHSSTAAMYWTELNWKGNLKKCRWNTNIMKNCDRLVVHHDTTDEFHFGTKLLAEADSSALFLFWYKSRQKGIWKVVDEIQT